MAKFAKGAAVRQIVTPIVGSVTGDFRVDQETGQLLVPVEWLDDKGEYHSRYFTEDQLELNPDD
jgi:hypothetical protein